MFDMHAYICKKICKSESNLQFLKQNQRCEKSKHLSFHTDESNHDVF